MSKEGDKRVYFCVWYINTKYAGRSPVSYGTEGGDASKYSTKTAVNSCLA